MWFLPVYLWRVVYSVLTCCTAAAGSLTDNPLLPSQINVLPCPTAIHEVNKSDEKNMFTGSDLILPVYVLVSSERMCGWESGGTKRSGGSGLTGKIVKFTLKLQLSQNFLQDFLFWQLCWWRDSLKSCFVTFFPIKNPAVWHSAFTQLHLLMIISDGGAWLPVVAQDLQEVQAWYKYLQSEPITSLFSVVNQLLAVASYL